MRDYTISFLGGIVASITVVVALNQQSQLDNKILWFWGGIFYLTGLFGLFFINYLVDGIKKWHKKNTNV